MIIIIMLMYTVSHALLLPPCINILNLCPNTKLVSPVYFGDGAICLKLFGQQVDIGTKMKASFEINISQDDFGGALLFKLQRYSDSQHNIDTSTTEDNEDEAMHVHMLVVWKLKDAKPFVRATLVGHTKEFV
jgi:hypothetical protein